MRGHFYVNMTHIYKWSPYTYIGVALQLKVTSKITIRSQITHWYLDMLFYKALQEKLIEFQKLYYYIYKYIHYHRFLSNAVTAKTCMY